MMRPLRDWIALPAVALLTAFALAGCGRGTEATAGAEETASRLPAEELPTPGEDASALAEERAQLEAQKVEMAERQAALEQQEADLVRQRREADLARQEAELKRREARLAEREQAEREAARRELPARQEETPALAEAAPAPEPEVAPRLEPEPAPRRETVALTVPAGTAIEVEFLDTVGSAESAPGDEFRARVTRDVVVENLVAFPAGSVIRGEVIEAVPLKKVGGKAHLALDFRRLELPSGEAVAVAASFAEAGKSETKRDAATIGGAAAGGAVLGRILAGDKDKKKGTVLGAIIGAAAGTAIASKTEGQEVTIPRGTVVDLTLDDWVRVLVER